MRSFLPAPVEKPGAETALPYQDITLREDSVCGLATFPEKGRIRR
jgi:hypothetical protein